MNDITYEVLNALLKSGKLVPNKVKVLPGGLNAVRQGWELGQAHKVCPPGMCRTQSLMRVRHLQISGEKFVYRIADTAF